MSTKEFVVESDSIVGDGGFLSLRRLRLRNQNAAGVVSAPYTCDFVVRPYGQDAVVAVVFSRGLGNTVQVLLRDGLRPSLLFGRNAVIAPLPEPAPSAWSRELVAGILETTDHGESGLRTRACAEVWQEAGFTVSPDRVILLGAGTYLAPGPQIEKVYFVATEVTQSEQQSLPGDGTPMEEGATTHWMSLEDALWACVKGDLCDAKTELGLRRFSDWLRS
jgi:ADP-ribose pyrophosphatase